MRIARAATRRMEAVTAHTIVAGGAGRDLAGPIPDRKPRLPVPSQPATSAADKLPNNAAGSGPAKAESPSGRPVADRRPVGGGPVLVWSGQRTGARILTLLPFLGSERWNCGASGRPAGHQGNCHLAFERASTCRPSGCSPCALGHGGSRPATVLFAPAYRLVQELLAAKRDLDNAPAPLVPQDSLSLPQGAEESEVLFTLSPTLRTEVLMRIFANPWPPLAGHVKPGLLGVTALARTVLGAWSLTPQLPYRGQCRQVNRQN